MTEVSTVTTKPAASRGALPYILLSREALPLEISSFSVDVDI